MRTALERDVVAVAELARLEAHDAARELGRASVECHDVVEAAHREELRRAAVELRAEYLQRRHDLRLAAVRLHGVDGRVAREWRMVAVVPRQVGEERLHALAILVEPYHLAPDLRAVGAHGVLEVRRAEREVSLVVPGVEPEA